MNLFRFEMKKFIFGLNRFKSKVGWFKSGTNRFISNPNVFRFSAKPPRARVFRSCGG